VALIVTFAATGPVLGQNSDPGVDAYNRGDYSRAYAEWLPRANAGEASAQFYLGVLYDAGEGVPQDYAQAASWYRKAADQGNPGAQYHLGVMYKYGQGVPKDLVEAFVWLDRSAALYEAASDFEYLADAVKNRDEVYAAMTTDQRAAADARRANP
jgi:hypothetical protein